MGSSIVAHTLSIACTTVANILAWKMYKGMLKPNNVKESTEHRELNAKIEMKKSGQIIIDTSKSNSWITVKAGNGRLFSMPPVKS